MLIRTQNGVALLPFNGAYIYENNRGEHVIECAKTEIWLGCYATEEDAKLVLDTFQAIHRGDFNTVVGRWDISYDCRLAGVEFMSVYEMPSKQEVSDYVGLTEEK